MSYGGCAMDDLDRRAREHCFAGVGRGRDLKCEADYKDGALAERARGLTVDERQAIAYELAKQRGDTFGCVPRDKRHWIEGHGIFQGRPRDINEPYQSDYLEMADVAYTALMARRAKEGG